MGNLYQGGPILPITILRLPALMASTGLSRSTLYLRVAQGLWTRPISLGARAVGWPSNEVDAIHAARIAGQSDDDVRALVRRLHDSRRQGGVQ
jgi:prophage regulatory protein